MPDGNMDHPPESFWPRIRHHLRTTLLVGLLILVPFAITYVVLHWVFNAIDGILQPVFHTALGWSIPGLGLLALIVMVYILGLIWNNLRIGRRIIQTGQHSLLNIPVVSAIYGPARQLIESFGGNRTAGFKRVVVEYPKEGAWMIGFLTGISNMTPGEMMGVVYLPTAPTPNSGWVAIIPVKHIYDTTLTVQQAMTMVLSGGISSPLQIDLHIIDPQEAVAYMEQGPDTNPNEVSGAFKLPFLNRGDGDEA